MGCMNSAEQQQQAEGAQQLLSSEAHMLGKITTMCKRPVQELSNEVPCRNLHTKDKGEETLGSEAQGKWRASQLDLVQN